MAIQKAWYVVTHPSGIDLPTSLCGAAALVFMVLLARTRIDTFSSLVALLVPTVAVWLTGAAGVALVKDNGSLPHGIPAPGVPDPGTFSLPLVVGAASVAAIVLVQGAGVAEARPNPDGSRSSTRGDFTAQGVWMIAILLVFSELVGEVAMATLAAVLIYAGWGTIKPREIWSVANAGPIPAIAMTATFLAVLLLPVATAVGVGVVASLIMQLNQESLDLRLVRLRLDAEDRLVEDVVPTELKPYDVVVIDVYGSLFFAGTHTLQRRLPPPLLTDRGPDAASGPVVILRLRGRTTLGATFLKVVGDYAHQLAAAGGELYLSGVDHRLVRRWDEDGLSETLGNVRIFEAMPVIGASTRVAITLGRTHRVSARSSSQSSVRDGDDLDDTDTQ
ncbi:hypothetical protein GCM10023350_35400 [Nocardioides endophyticus]|uniref:STAS domain-containing protein n=1 Tax=Nocardioides endophyticus TaxID=1353775 RepID=A0ABP8Z661_9ACTN